MFSVLNFVFFRRDVVFDIRFFFILIFLVIIFVIRKNIFIVVVGLGGGCKGGKRDK